MGLVSFFTEFFRGPRDPRRCRHCQVDGFQGLPVTAFPNLELVEPWKRGRLYQCLTCQSRWFLHEHGQIAGRIRDELWPLAKHWNRTSLLLDEDLRRTLASIGGVADWSRDQITIPCRVRTASGEWEDFAVVLVSKVPPYFWYKPSMIRWADAISELAASDAALPLEVRHASAKADEVRMGFAPTGVIDDQGNEYTLDWKGVFFDHRGVKGKDVRLSGRKRWWREHVSPTPAQSFYFVDWFEGCEGEFRVQ